MTQTKVLIYGGCVTRDAFEHLDDSFKLVGYLARQSLISAASPATGLLTEASLQSSFQNRSLNGDIGSSLFGSVRSAAPKVDLFVIDILSERLGVFKLADGSYITHSGELGRSGLLNSLEIKPSLLRFGTDRHFATWKSASTKFVGVLKNSKILEKTIHIETPWASKTDTGDDVEPFRGLPAEQANEMYERYFEHLRNLGVRSCRLPLELAVSSNRHKWGPNPYHYAEPAYLWMRDVIHENRAR